MVSAERFDAFGVIFHVTNHSVVGDLFLDELDRLRFLEYLKLGLERFSCKLHAFCLMGNHYHLLLESSGDMGKLFQLVQSKYSRYFNRKYNKKGVLWQTKYRSSIILSEAHYFNAYSYILMNPVKDGFVSNTCDWLWSSVFSFPGVEGKVLLEVDVDYFKNIARMFSADGDLLLVILNRYYSESLWGGVA